MVFLNFCLLMENGSVQTTTDADPGGIKTYGSYRSGTRRKTRYYLPFASGKPPAGEEKRLDHLPLEVRNHQLLPNIVLRVSGQEAEGVEVARPPVQQLVRNVGLQVPAAEMSFVI
jgi:hypothetical protein